MWKTGGSRAATVEMDPIPEDRYSLAPNQVRHGGKGSSMRRKDGAYFTKLVRAERRRWQENLLLSPGALSDFQKLSGEAFRSMRGKYYRPTDLIADIHSRRFLS